MLPPAALQKSGSYAVELERWARIFPRSQIKARHRPRHRLRHRPRRRVGESRCAHGESAPGSLAPGSGGRETRRGIHARSHPLADWKVIVTDELTRGSQRIMNETFDFLQLPRMPIGNQSRFCVRGKAGVMDVLHASELNITIGRD